MTKTNLHNKIHVKHGFPFKSKFFSKEGDYIVLTPGNFYEEGGFKRQIGKEKFYIGDIPEEYILTKGDVIVAMTEQSSGLLGSCAIIPKDNIYLHNQRLGLITTNEEELDKLFVFHLFKTKHIRKQLSLTSTGSKVKHTSPNKIYELKVQLPLLSTQKKIVSVLSALDSKIEINNQINRELEVMAKTIYDYWFVQFDFPNENSKPYRSSGGEMVWNEEIKKAIPKGWKVECLYDIATYTNGLAMQKYRPNGDDFLPVIKIREMRSGYTSSTEKARIDINDRHKVKKGDVLFSWSASLNIMIWSDKDGALNQHIFKVTSSKYPRYFYFYQISNYLNHFKKVAESRKTTMGHITKDHLIQSKIVVPDDKTIISKLEEPIEDIINLIIKNKEQNQALKTLRDWLLPMLINGQVKVE